MIFDEKFNSLSDFCFKHFSPFFMSWFATFFCGIQEGSKATAEDIKEYCSKNLAKIKQPKYVEIVEEIPRNSVGKVLMSKVHELYGNVD